MEEVVDEKNTSLFSRGRIIFYFFSLLVFSLAIRYVGQLKDIRRLLLEMSPGWLILALTTQVATYFCNVLILRTLLRGKTGTADFITLFKLSVVILFVNQVLPSGGLSGNGYIFGELHKREIPAQAAFKALVLESICYYIAFLTLLAIFYGWYTATVPGSPVMAYTVLMGFVFFMFLCAFMLVLANRRAIAWVMGKLSRFKRVRAYIERKGLLSLGQEGGTSWRGLFKDKPAILKGILLQATILSCDGLTIFSIFQGFHVHMAPEYIMLGFLLSQIIGSLPISPGALIAYESAMTYFYSLLGAPVHAALIVTLLFRFFSFWLPIPAGLWLYRDLRRHRP